ncbi:cyclic pyranopterin monophosphate synthase subunit MoaA [Frondihabitans sp. PhB188]|uniref:GTP 3',8-cyclase MoaA n=1 Tax=Frondihabitans sp. PhB188 TaxID=2485200 RepID=UPI000F49E621|nr:GTP 3',8-cyclase MoaA [Frondihabitans sp. PhB188]ROQ38579.1 cyclic pyranopterin monophosphate synthase subunit MoaA [Frondihabitans sp. PhB188]
MVVSLGIPTLPGRVHGATDGRPATPGLVDRFGRTATDLRVSLTDRCNLRCTYCMPADGLPWLDREQALSADEIVRLVEIGVRDLGVRQVRFTGGEPLLRADLVDIIARCAALEPRPELSLTTNAIGLASRAESLAAAGLDRINVSLDSLHAETFMKVTRRPFLERVLEGVDAAAAAGLGPIKINAVLLPGVNDHEAPALLRWALEQGHELRYIEQMPLDADHTWSRSSMVTAADVRALLAPHFGLAPVEAPRDGAPAERFTATATDGSGLTGTVGIIASVTEPFCVDCRRTRLTAEGSVRSCLFSHTETDLRESLRSGADDAAIAELWRGAMWQKPAGHGLDDPSFVQPARSMSAIGG